MFRKLASLVALVAALAGVPAFAQNGQTFPQKNYYASDYGTWAIRGQAANTYTFFPIQTCQVPAPSQGTYFPFNTNAPIYISDATPSNSELLTPSAVTPSAANPSSSQCGVTVTAVNNHYSFSIISGTGGLQEALNQIPSNVAYQTTVILDRNWYSSINSIAQTVATQNAAAVIASVAGAYNTILLDNTTAPYTVYQWNGTKYIALGNPASVPFNLRQSTYTALAAPTALSTSAATNGIITTATTGGSIPASSTYRLGITYVDAAGQETTLSTDTASTATIATGSGTATNTISITSPAALAGAVGYRLYMTAASGASLSEILYSPTCTQTTLQSVLPSATVCAIGSPATITAIVTGTAAVPLVSTAYARVGSATSSAYSPFPALGTVASTVVGNLGTINIPAGFLNSLGKSLTMCGNGYATTNSTPGTLTLATKLASLVGTTSITPFTAVSGTTTASASVSFNFCETWTTSATGATGTLEAHGWVIYGLAGTAVGTAAQDFIIAASSTVDLTKQDQIQFTITPTTTGTTAAQLRQLTITQQN